MDLVGLEEKIDLANGSIRPVRAMNGILLDINAAWVHFTAFRLDDSTMTAEPLFEEGMETNTDRYLNQSSRDFFYITAK